MDNRAPAIVTRDWLDFVKRMGILCYRVLRHPEKAWYMVHNESLAKDSSTTKVLRSVYKVIEQPDNTHIAKYPSTRYIVKSKTFKDIFKAEEYAIDAAIAYRVPFLKLKPPMPPVRTYQGDYRVDLVMAELSGVTLKALFFEGHYSHQRILKMSLMQRLQIMMGLAWSLQSDIHVNHIVHRDITPDNAMVDLAVNPPKVKIFDFDLAKLAEKNDRRFRCGTGYFMSLEALDGDNKTYKTDVYGLAWLFYFLLNGRLPQMDTWDDVRVFASQYQPMGLFSGIEKSFNENEKQCLSDLLEKMFDSDQDRRIDLQSCINVVEDLLLTRMLNNERREDRAKFEKAYLLGKLLRLNLIEVAFAHRIGEKPLQNIAVMINDTLDELSDLPNTLPMFLSGLKVEMLMGMTSVEAIKQKVRETIAAFSQHYEELTRLNATDEREGIRFLLDYYGGFCWSLDNLRLVDKKLVKALARENPQQPTLTR